MIFTNGIINDYGFVKDIIKDYDYFIACDGGLRHMEALDIIPDCIIGDMDSVPMNLNNKYKNHATEQIIYPVKKDETDLALALEYALAKCVSSIIIIGATGSRFDHSLANVHLLVMGMDKLIEIRDENTSIQLINKKGAFYKESYNTLSLIPLTPEVRGIKTQGLIYPLDNETLRIGTTRGISNEFLTTEASISVEEGMLLVIRSK